MTDERPRGVGWWALLALPVVCCVGHAVLITVGLGSLTAVAGGVTNSVALVSGGLLLVAAAAVVLLRHRGQRPAPSADQPARPARTLDQGAP